VTLPGWIDMAARGAVARILARRAAGKHAGRRGGVPRFGGFSAETLEQRWLLSVGPVVQSINRAVPSGPGTTGSSVTYTVTFNEAVAGVDGQDFHVLTGGTAAVLPGVIVTPVSRSVYSVT
jgi:hypothetical protein